MKVYKYEMSRLGRRTLRVRKSTCTLFGMWLRVVEEGIRRVHEWLTENEDNIVPYGIIV